jgi:hypothetical protein
MLNVNYNFRIVAKFVTVSLPNISHANIVGMLVIHVNTKFYTPICAAQLILHIEPKRKEILLIAASCFYIRQKYYPNKVTYSSTLYNHTTFVDS